MYVYICIFIYIYVCIYRHIYVYIYVYIDICMYMYICKHVYLHIHTYICMYICMYIYIWNMTFSNAALTPMAQLWGQPSLLSSVCCLSVFCHFQLLGIWGVPRWNFRAKLLVIWKTAPIMVFSLETRRLVGRVSACECAPLLAYTEAMHFWLFTETSLLLVLPDLLFPLFPPSLSSVSVVSFVLLPLLFSPFHFFFTFPHLLHLRVETRHSPLLIYARSI